MKGNFKATTALALLTTTQLPAKTESGSQLPTLATFQKRVAEEFNEIPRQERMNAYRAIAVGLGLHLVKASVKHGQFTPWLQANVTQGNFWTPATAKKNASFYMRLAIAFVEKSGVTQPELLSLPAGKVDLSAEMVTGKITGPQAKLAKRLEDFVGEFSLNELLVEHGIKDGGKGSGGGSAASGSDEDPLLANTAEWLMNLRNTLLDPESIKRFTPSALDDIERQLASGLDQFRKLRAKLRGN